jgi:hypothetical protein
MPAQVKYYLVRLIFCFDRYCLFVGAAVGVVPGRNLKMIDKPVACFE